MDLGWCYVEILVDWVKLLYKIKIFVRFVGYLFIEVVGGSEDLLVSD